MKTEEAGAKRKSRKRPEVKVCHFRHGNEALKAPIPFEQRLFLCGNFKYFKYGGGKEEKTKAKRFN